VKRIVFVLWGLFVTASALRADLKTYVNEPDKAYRWEKRDEAEVFGVKCVELRMTSQEWRGIQWKHLLYVARPAEQKTTSHGLLVVAGSSWKAEYDGPAADKTRVRRNGQLIAALAGMAKMPVAVVEHIPFQPIFDGKKEDEIISYTFDQYLKSPDPTWPLLLPMVKSAARAMDAVQEFAQKEWDQRIETFTVTGGSKRGWTTWLTAAADPRVRSIAPMVIDVLNMQPQMKHQLDTWGTYSEMIEDYTKLDIPRRMNTPLGQQLTSIVDPYAYRQSLTLPKLIVLGSNDRYWPLDALNLYWDGLSGEKYVLYVPNNGHGLKDLERVFRTTAAMALAGAGKFRFPKLTWELGESADGLALKLASDQTPKSVSAWATTAPTRDFRDSTWRETKLNGSGSTFAFRQPRPADGFAAVFGEAVYEIDGQRLYLSTNVKIQAAAGGK
jgi:PhoPQ-activated pathogenicity-related protein